MNLSAIARRLAHLGVSGETTGEGPRAAVAAILRQREGADSADLFFIRRADRTGDPWSGHIAFPGGRAEPTDDSILVTAIRETCEEVGIDLTNADLVARLPDLLPYTRTKRAVTVTPFVFALKSDVVPTPNEEVAGTYWIPFDKLARGEGRGTFPWVWEGKTLELPCIRFEPGGEILWGMTYRMLETMIEALGPEDDAMLP
ncbi:MutT/nudix family protein [Labilithrix luteola]|uniref:MutT/nudix family protein n=1 Tax=Labilithrix luteola TaxID=1391654 RepID=A0A0K1QFK8_9BACT|nr:CoA pyrophosphatase [Labilithrix luteola]AKV04549.1 MutT/nudix family protein [Labilithrix luteola]